MPLWGKTDSFKDKPKFPVEQFDRAPLITVSCNVNASGATVIALPQGSTASLANGYMANGVNVGATIGTPGFNLLYGPTIVNKTSNTVTLSSAIIGNLNAGQQITFSIPMLPISSGNGNNALSSANSYNANTIFVTASRMKSGNHWSNVHVSAPGHVHIKTGLGMRAGRIQAETLVCLSNGVASVVGSGGQYFTGL